jgi:multidrug transporter EmrE-like cation transporter
MLAALPWPVLAGLILTPVMIAAGQILFKLASGRTGAADISGLLGLAANPYLLVALVIYGLGTVVWIYVIKNVPLNYAYPFMALTFCVVPVLAWYFLGEAYSLKACFGTALIMAGLLVIAL